jgi:hypothetical protein
MLSKGSFFRSAASIANHVPEAKDYYFVDASVIIGFRRNQYPELDLQGFINNPNHEFFYTETVLEELKLIKFPFPESNPSHNPASNFRFVNSHTTKTHKESAVDLLFRIWQAEFKNTKMAIQKGLWLTEDEIKKSKKDLFVIFEAGYVCHAPGVLPDDDFRTPPLLINNMPFMNKFLLRPQTERLLENAINLSGLEHLIPVQLLTDTVQGWEEEMKVSSNSKRQNHS